MELNNRFEFANDVEDRNQIAMIIVLCGEVAKLAKKYLILQEEILKELYQSREVMRLSYSS